MKRILVPVDFSPAMEGVLATAREMAEAFQAELHLIHVREIAALPVFPAATIGYPGIGMPEMGLPGAQQIDPAVFGSQANPNDRSRLDRLQDELSIHGRPCFAHEPEGAVVEELLRAADAIRADLVVMGSHGHGSVYNLLVGSVTEGVLKAARSPVLLVPAPAERK
ncbi:MAG TPA: universal stress protein [Chthoniobacterales bacterium]|jgi:nucleotide-binding universal stress UspA family protein